MRELWKKVAGNSNKKTKVSSKTKNKNIQNIQTSGFMTIIYWMDHIYSQYPRWSNISWKIRTNQ